MLHTVQSNHSRAENYWKYPLRLLMLVGILLSAGLQTVQAAQWQWSNPLPQGNNLNDVVWNQQVATPLFVAVGNGGAVVSSADAISWNVQSSGVTSDLRGVIWNGSQYVAVGASGTIITSSDGVSWTTQSSGTVKALRDIAWNGSQFVVVGALGTVLSSPDGQTWSVQTTPSTGELYGVNWNGAQFVTVGDVNVTSDGTRFIGVANAQGKVLTSSDGLSWSTQQISIVLPAGVPTPSVNIEAKYFLRDITWDGSQYVVVGGKGKILTGTDGISWVEQVSGTTNTLSKVAWSGTQFVAIVGRGQILTSTTGTNWAEQNYTGSYHLLMGVVWGGTQFVAVGQNGSIVTSSDAVTWIVRLAGVTNNLHDLFWSGTQFVAVGLNGTILTSPNSLAWTQRTAIAVNELPSGQIIDQSTPLKAVLNSVIWNGTTQYVAVGSAGTIVVSADGINWLDATINSTVNPPTSTPISISWLSTPTLPATASRSPLNGLVWNGSQYIAVGSKGTILTSPDGLVWLERNSGTTQDLFHVIWDVNNSQFVAVGAAGTLLTSPNGISWSAQTTGATQSLFGIAWSGTQFVVVGDKGTILNSSDGMNWVTQASNLKEGLRDVYWDGLHFIAVGAKGAILTSADGVVWVAQSFNAVSPLKAISSDGNQYVVVGNGGVIIRTNTLLAISTANFPAVIANTAYTATLSALNGVAPYSWAISSGTLPAGLTLDTTTGVISGTVTAVSVANFTVEVTDSAAMPVKETHSFSLEIARAKQSIAFNLPRSATIGDSASLSAVATSGLPVAYSTTSPNICVITGATVSFNAKGICTVFVKQLGNETYIPAIQNSAGVIVFAPKTAPKFSAPAKNGGSGLSLLMLLMTTLLFRRRKI